MPCGGARRAQRTARAPTEKETTMKSASLWPEVIQNPVLVTTTSDEVVRVDPEEFIESMALYLNKFTPEQLRRAVKTVLRHQLISAYDIRAESDATRQARIRFYRLAGLTRRRVL
jgi:hypothetical protein